MCTHLQGKGEKHRRLTVSGSFRSLLFQPFLKILSSGCREVLKFNGRCCFSSQQRNFAPWSSGKHEKGDRAPTTAYAVRIDVTKSILSHFHARASVYKPPKIDSHALLRPLLLLCQSCNLIQRAFSTVPHANCGLVSILLFPAFFCILRRDF